jgi:hypothetical protein
MKASTDETQIIIIPESSYSSLALNVLFIPMSCLVERGKYVA